MSNYLWGTGTLNISFCSNAVHIKIIVESDVCFRGSARVQTKTWLSIETRTQVPGSVWLTWGWGWHWPVRTSVQIIVTVCKWFLLKSSVQLFYRYSTHYVKLYARPFLPHLSFSLNSFRNNNFSKLNKVLTCQKITKTNNSLSYIRPDLVTY